PLRPDVGVHLGDRRAPRGGPQLPRRPQCPDRRRRRARVARQANLDRHAPGGELTVLKSPGDPRADRDTRETLQRGMRRGTPPESGRYPHGLLGLFLLLGAGTCVLAVLRHQDGDLGGVADMCPMPAMLATHPFVLMGDVALARRVTAVELDLDVVAHLELVQ